MVLQFLLFLVGDQSVMISVHIYKQDIEVIVVNGNGTEPGHIIVTSIDGRNGQAKQVLTEPMIHCHLMTNEAYCCFMCCIFTADH
jgi:hypothetical protein